MKNFIRTPREETILTRATSLLFSSGYVIYYDSPDGDFTKKEDTISSLLLEQ